MQETKMKAPRKTFLVDRDTSIVVVPAGRYFLGDPCYSVRREDWMPWLEAADYENETTILYGLTTDGFPVFGFGTAYGDGCWTGSDGFRYGADAGLIGLVPVEHNPTAQEQQYTTEVQNIVEFDRPTRCRRDENGCMWFGSVRINTAGGR